MHHCEDCKHENVKYCPKCKKVYCVDCGREWEDACTLNHYPNYWYLCTYPPYTTSTSGYAASADSSTYIVTGDGITSTACGHD
jgi:hypothetical protein